MSDKFQSLDDAYKEQMSEYPNRSYDMNPNWAKEHPEEAAQAAKVSAEYEAKAKENRMQNLKKTVLPMKTGGKVKDMFKRSSVSKRADGIAQKGHTRGKYC